MLELWRQFHKFNELSMYYGEILQKYCVYSIMRAYNRFNMEKSLLVFIK